MSQLKRSVSNAAVSQLASLLMSTNIQGRIYHLQSTTFAHHIALDEFYKGISKAQDTIIELMQGIYGIVRGYKMDTLREDNQPVEYLHELRSRISVLRVQLPITQPISNLQNEIDNAVTLIDTVLYKLENLK